MKNLAKLLGFGAVVALLYYIWTQVPVGSFFWLLTMNIVLILFVFLFFAGTKNAKLSKGVRMVAILICGGLCVFSFNRYVNPESIKIFGNNDHHALAIEGVKLGSPQNFTLVGNSNRAFYDDKDTKGFVTLSAISRDTLINAGVSSDFSNVIYERGSNSVYSAIVPSNYEFKAGFDTGKVDSNVEADKVLLVDENGNQVLFSIIESYRKPKGVKQNLRELFGKKSRCARYTLEYVSEGVVDSTYDILRDGTYYTLKSTTKKLKEGDNFEFINQNGKRAKLSIVSAKNSTYDKEEKAGLAFELRMEGEDGSFISNSALYTSKELDSKRIAAGDVVELMDSEGNRAVISIAQLSRNTTGWKDRLSSVFSKKKYRFELLVEAEMRSTVSSFDSFLKQGYPLASIFPANKSMIDLNGVYVVRPKWKMAAKDKELESIYSESKYRLVFSNQSTIKEVYINGQRCYNAVDADVRNFTFKTNTIYAIGNGTKTFAPFRFMIENDTICLRFQMPIYRMLNAEYRGEKDNDDERSFMIASTLLDSEQTINMLPRNVLLYDLFSHHDNINHIAPSYISFRRDKSEVPLRFSIFTPQTNSNKSYASANENIGNIASVNNANVSWLIDVDNFKDCSAKRAVGINNPYNYKHLVAVLLFCIAAALMLVSMSSSAMECIAHIVLLSFITVRLFLLWRVSVFPPVEAITLNEFNGIFRNTLSFGPLTYIVASLAVCYLVLFIVKLSTGERIRDIIENPKKFAISLIPIIIGPVLGLQQFIDVSISWYWLVVAVVIAWLACFGFYLLVRIFRDRSKALAITFCVFIVLSMLLCIALHFAFNQRIVNILAPISFYFFWDFLINKFFGKEDGCRSGENEFTRTLLTILNIGTSFAALFVSDGGYGIMFLAYAVISLILHLSFVHRLDVKKSDKYWAIVVLFIFGAFFLGLYKEILVGLFNSSYVWLIVGVALSLIFNFLLYVFDDNFDFWSRRTKIWFVGIVAFSFAVGFGVNWGFGTMKGSHTEHRVRVLTETPDVSLGKMSTLQQERKFLQASLNDWVMGVYVDKGKDVSAIIGEDGRGYFKMHPHSKHGALWGAQCTDISVARFLIAEHGSGVVWLLISLLILLLISGFMSISDRLAHWKRSLAYQLPLLMLLQALIVYFALTRHFVFIGQDFPMISITSNLTTIMFILIIGLWIYVCNISCGDDQIVRHTNRINNSNNKISDRFKYYGELCGIFAIIIIVCFIFEVSKHQKNDRYDVPDCVQALCSTLGVYEGRVGAIAEAFEQYQNEQIERYNSNNRSNIYDIRRLFSGQECLRKFCKYVDYDSTNPYIIESDSCSVIDKVWREDKKFGPFCKNIFDRFVNKAENDTDALMFLVPKKRTDENGRVHTRYGFSFNPHYYVLQMPNKINESWRGSVVEQSAPIDNFEYVSEGKYDIYILPKEWGDGINPVRIVKAKSSDVAIVGDTKPHLLSIGESCVINYNETLLCDGSVEDMKRCGNATYWAKNVLINGVTSFVYPMGDKMFWMHHYAEQVKNNSELKKNNANVEITLSRSLTKNIIDKMQGANLNDKHRSISAVVANGNGEIWAMTGCNAPKYRVNPNDKRQIKEIEDSLKLIGEYNWGTESERYFANPALVSLAHGPGSSQKPLVWTAVTTAYNDDMWKNLVIKNNERLYDDSGCISPFWGGVSFGDKKRGNVDVDRQRWNTNDNDYRKNRVVFRSIWGDEVYKVNEEYRPITLERYITKSSNYYNAVMVHLGSLPIDRLGNAFARNSADSIVRQVRGNLTGFDFVQKAFPTLSIGGNKNWTFKYKLQKKDIFDRSSALLTGFANLGLHISDKAGYYRDTTARINYSHYLSTGKFGFAYPSASSFLNYKRVGARAEENEIVNYGVRQTAIGAKSVWEVSPLKMAEMYGRMISLNKGYNLTIHKREPKEVGKVAFELNNPYMDKYIANRKAFIQGLSNVFNANAGTAVGVKNAIDRSLMEGLYFYAKTGTIDNGKENGKGRVSDHLLAVVITNQNINDIEDWDALQDVRFVVIYLADLGYGYNSNTIWDWEPMDASIIEEVLKSEEFKNYMFN